MKFKTVSERFHIIDGAGYTIYVPLGEGVALAEKLRQNGPSRALLRQLGQYAVSVYRQYFEELCRTGALERISENAGILQNTGLYSSETGLPFEISEQSQAIFI